MNAYSDFWKKDSTHEKLPAVFLRVLQGIRLMGIFEDTGMDTDKSGSVIYYDRPTCQGRTL